MLKTIKLKALLSISLTLTIAAFSCKKNDQEIKPIASAELSLKDTLIVQAVAPTSPFWDIYQNYNGKVYKILKSTKVKKEALIKDGKIIISLTDTTNINTPTKLEISINDQKESLASSYTLINNNKVQISMVQKFIDGSNAFTGSSAVVNGTLTINYNAKSKTLNGEIKQLTFPLEYFVPENISMFSRSSNGVLLKNLSTREFNITFKNILIN